jgi:peptidyl-prolyl cis-trans isomerase C
MARTHRNGTFTLLVFTATLILLNGCVATSPTATSGKQQVPEVSDRTLAAKVNGQPIYEDQLEARVEANLRQYKKRSHSGKVEPELEKEMQRQVLDKFIVTELFYQASLSLKIPDIEKRITEEMAKAKQTDHPDMGREKISDAALRENIRRKLYLTEYLAKVDLVDPQPPEAEIKAYYEKNKKAFANGKDRVEVRHILIQVAKDATPEEKDEARKKIEQARQLILEGKPFDEAAKEYSDDANAPRGGNMGYIEPAYMPPEFDKVAFSLEPGKLSDIVETEFGYHVLEVLDVRAKGTVPPYDQLKNFLGKYLQEGLIKKKMAAHTKSLRENAKIETFLVTAPDEIKHAQGSEEGI